MDNEKHVKILFEDLTYNSVYSLLEVGKDDDELKEIANKRGLVVPSRDLAIMKIRYAMVDKQNKNKCTLPKKEVEKALKTLVGKAVDKDHLRKNTVGVFLDSQLEEKEIIAYASFWKSNFPEDFEEVKEKMSSGKVKVSFEAWGDRQFKENGSYDLTNIEFAGGALLFETEPAFQQAEVLEMSNKVLEFAKVIEGENDDSKKEKTLQIEEAKLDFNYDLNNIARVVYQHECASCKTKGFQDVQAIDFEASKIKHKCGYCGQVTMTDLSPKSVIVKKGKKIPVAMASDNITDSGGKEMEEKIKQLEQELATLKTQMEEKVKELASKTEELEKATSLVETLKKESEESKVKIETMEKEIASKVEEAKKSATIVAERKAELAEFAKDVKDEDLLNESKYENLKLKKALAEKDAEIAALKDPTKTSVQSATTMSKGSKDKKTDETSISRKKVQEAAFGKQE